MAATSAAQPQETPDAVGDAAAIVRLLGVPEVRVGGQRYPLGAERRHVMLVYLAAGRQWVPRERIAALLWPDHGHAAALRNLRYVLFQARALPFCRELRIDAQGLRWPVPTDLQQLRRAVAERQWAQALALCRGPLLDGLDVPPALRDWVDAQRACAQALWREAVLRALADPSDLAIDGARQLLSHDALDEPVLLALCDALSRLGRAAEAAQHAREFAQRVRRHLGIEPTAALQAFLEPLRDRRAGLAAGGALTPFFGRASELRDIEILAAEPDCRLLSLVGVGGSGKTRLARHLAEREPGPAVWVALEAVQSGEAVARAVARAIDPAAADASAAPELLVDALREQGTRLLVLDNAEHVADALTPLIVTLLGRCAALRVLVTSRERLGVDGEWVMPVDGFACARSHDEDGEAELFFVACARRTLPGFAPSADDRAQVHELARLVGGSPLALELAAPWLRTLPLREIVQELRRDIGTLDLSLRGAPDRHRSLRASFEHSWRLLSEHERDALARLAAFTGGFTRDSATRVADVALPVLAALVEKCLLRYDSSGRYERHPLVHQFTQERLDNDAALAAATRQRHAAHFLGLLEDGSLRALPRRERLLRLRAEWPNILRATEWFAENADWPALDRCSRVIANDPSIFGNLDVAANWAGRILALAESAPEPAPAALIARLLADRLWLQVFLETPARVQPLAEAALQAARNAGERRAEVLVLRAMGHAARKATRHAHARSLFDQALRLARRHGFVVEEAMLLDALAMVENPIGEHGAAEAHARAALELNERIGQHEQRMYNYHSIGESLRLRGRCGEALPWLEQCVALAREIRFEQFLAYALVALAECRLARHERNGAWRDASEALTAALALDDPTATGLARVCLARMQLERCEPVAARVALHAALTAALRWSDAAVVVAAIPVAAQLCLSRPGDADRWLRWLRSHPEHGWPPVPRAQALLADAGEGAAAGAAAGAELPDDPMVVGREIEVALAP